MNIEFWEKTDQEKVTVTIKIENGNGLDVYWGKTKTTKSNSDKQISMKRNKIGCTDIANQSSY